MKVTRLKPWIVKEESIYTSFTFELSQSYFCLFFIACKQRIFGTSRQHRCCPYLFSRPPIIQNNALGSSYILSFTRKISKWTTSFRLLSKWWKSWERWEFSILIMIFLSWKCGQAWRRFLIVYHPYPCIKKASHLFGKAEIFHAKNGVQFLSDEMWGQIPDSWPSITFLLTLIPRSSNLCSPDFNVGGL